MEANLLLGMSSLILAAGAGATMLVLHRRNGNGNGKHPELSVSEEVKRDLWQVDKLAEVLEPLAHLPVRLEQSYRHLMEAHAKEPEIPPEWSARLLADLVDSLAHVPAHGPGPAASTNLVNKIGNDFTAQRSVRDLGMKLQSENPSFPVFNGGVFGNIS